VNITEVTVDVSGTQFPVKVYYNTADDCGWTAGRIETLSGVDHYESYIYEFEAKVYDGPSTFGINGGRIYKLYVRDISANTEVIGYDREWYCEPQYPQEKAVLEALLTIFSH
jgi:hypothetical protein